ncbi:PH domain-containing protein [Paenibacillus chitinolyticus]|uniref:PH domain-containing protein n=1 Tax=Paenibacillus chitinolyticus TaxID=79263 RepID=UPI002DB6842C|nr:PH domain-containing protein [Paenibacillus chitinolyticus]MEC0249180.1 PH domain-containing protein [Paenibacillus chitinolyticus]
MGILDGLLGNASEMSPEKLQKELEPFLIPGEQVQIAYKIIRDGFVFTNKRLILIDKQGVTGSKVEYMSVPYKSIIRYAKESAGTFDLDAELKIWLSSTHEPIVKKFNKSANINDVYAMLSRYVLG